MTSRPINFRGPLADSYLAAVGLVVFALIPYLALSSALQPLTPLLSKSLHLSDQAIALSTGMANAAYAFGTVLAVQFAVHLRGRRMLFLYATVALIGSVLAAAAPTPGLFVAGHLLQGLSTSLMLIAAVPPLVTGGCCSGPNSLRPPPWPRGSGCCFARATSRCWRWEG